MAITISSEDTTQDKVVIAALNAGLAPLLNGDPGIGKSAWTFDLANRHNLHPIVVIGGRKDPAFVEGLPIVKHTDAEGKPLDRPYTITTKPDWFIDALEVAGGKPVDGVVRDGVLLFFDEFRSTLEDVQAALLSFIQDRELDGVKLPDNVYIVLAANPVSTGANGQYITPPMANRLIHIDFQVPVEQWLRLLPQAFGKSASENELVEYARGAAYLQNNQAGTGIVATVVPQDPEKADGAYPSRRSWHNVFRMLAAVGNDRAARDMAMIATVGEDAALAFKTWDETLNLPSIEEVLRSYETLPWESYTTDKVFAIIVMATNMATAETLTTTAKVLVKVGDHHEALAALQGRELLTRARRLGVARSVSLDTAKVLSDKFRDILSEASGIATPRRA